jgi:hypothetical protein
MIERTKEWYTGGRYIGQNLSVIIEVLPAVHRLLAF